MSGVVSHGHWSSPITRTVVYEIITTTRTLVYSLLFVTSTTTGREAALPKRSDARRNIAAILDAATECLARTPTRASTTSPPQPASAGSPSTATSSPVGALIAEVASTGHAADGDGCSRRVDLDRRPARRARSAARRPAGSVTHRYGGLVLAAQTALPEPDDCGRPTTSRCSACKRLLRRGRREGCFRTDMPLDWQVMTIQGVIHAASGAVHRGEVTADAGARPDPGHRAGGAHTARAPRFPDFGRICIAVRN